MGSFDRRQLGQQDRRGRRRRRHRAAAQLCLYATRRGRTCRPQPGRQPRHARLRRRLRTPGRVPHLRLRPDRQRVGRDLDPQLGAAGRVALGLGASLAMLVCGVVFERREEYRTFAYGLIGGGWAALYTTVYAMYAIPAAKVLDNAFAATVLLLAVAAGMIVHSLKYRSQTVTALAYFLAFVTLAIADVTTFAVIMLIPLVASLLYIAYRNQWNRFAIFGLVATYLTCGLHKDTGSPLWQTQGLFLVYWLIFEGFDLLRADPWLLPLNALGFLALSAGKWTNAAPNDIWQLAAGAAALYLASTLVRARAGRWKPAVIFKD